MAKKQDCSEAKILKIMKDERDRVVEKRVKVWGGLAMFVFGVTTFLVGGAYHSELENYGTAILMAFCGVVTMFVGMNIMGEGLDK